MNEDYIEIFKEDDGDLIKKWHWRVFNVNGITVSRGYLSKHGALSAAKRTFGTLYPIKVNHTL